MPTAEWNRLINGSVGELYGVLCQTYEDYNVKQYAFTLVGGANGNQLQVGPNTAVPDFWLPRAVWLQIQGSSNPYVTIPRLTSLMERNLYTFPNIVPIYGAIPSCWNILGSTIEILPPSVAGASYVVWYVPACPVLVNDTDTIDALWLTVNGWQEYVVLDAAAKALIKEESLDTASLLLQAKKELRARILSEAKPRDISQPQAIVDMQRVRNLWPGGVPGAAPGWGGGDFGGGGCW
jgi:hypothetical protein